MEIKKASSKEDFTRCWEAMQKIRPCLSLDQYLVLNLYMQDEGYKLIFTDKDEKIVAFCGYRYQTMIHYGRSIYIDDVFTLPAARHHATVLLNYVIREAKTAGVQSIHLDSLHQRSQAHRLYMNYGFKIESHHFVLRLKSSEENFG
ncbi:MAG: GNAT family N-acetyltransferase [Chitinophagaceae bacterium]